MGSGLIYLGNHYPKARVCSKARHYKQVVRIGVVFCVKPGKGNKLKLGLHFLGEFLNKLKIG